MNVPVVARREDFELALAAARKIDSGADVTGFASRMDGAFLGRLDEAWSSVEGALRKGYELGKEKAKAALDAAIAEVEQLLADAGSQARELQASLLRRMHEFTQCFIQSAMARVPTVIDVGGARFTLAAVRCTQRLVVTGSITTNLTELFALAANGEIEIATDYAGTPIPAVKA
jgi:hypothetical protein